MILKSFFLIRRIKKNQKINIIIIKNLKLIIKHKRKAIYFKKNNHYNNIFKMKINIIKNIQDIWKKVLRKINQIKKCS